MNKLISLFLFFMIFVFSACTEEGYIKVFECEDNHPVFSKITHRCYATFEDREASETKFLEDAQKGKNTKPSKDEDEDDYDDEDDEDDDW